MGTEQDYTIGELATLAGVTARTVRYYISIGLLAAPDPAGPQTRYGAGHLARLRLIRRLQHEHLPLGEIRSRLEGLDDEAVEQALESGVQDSALDYIRRLRAQQTQTTPTQTTSRLAKPGLELWGAVSVTPSLAGPQGIAAESAPQEPTFIRRTQWERVTLSADVELHVRRPLSRIDQKRVERLIRIGRELLEQGDQP